MIVNIDFMPYSTTEAVIDALKAKDIDQLTRDDVRDIIKSTDIAVLSNPNNLLQIIENAGVKINDVSETVGKLDNDTDKKAQQAMAECFANNFNTLIAREDLVAQTLMAVNSYLPYSGDKEATLTKSMSSFLTTEKMQSLIQEELKAIKNGAVLQNSIIEMLQNMALFDPDIRERFQDSFNPEFVHQATQDMDIDKKAKVFDMLLNQEISFLSHEQFQNHDNQHLEECRSKVVALSSVLKEIQQDGFDKEKKEELKNAIDGVDEALDQILETEKTSFLSKCVDRIKACATWMGQAFGVEHKSYQQRQEERKSENVGMNTELASKIKGDMSEIIAQAQQIGQELQTQGVKSEHTATHTPEQQAGRETKVQAPNTPNDSSKSSTLSV